MTHKSLRQERAGVLRATRRSPRRQGHADHPVDQARGPGREDRPAAHRRLRRRRRPRACEQDRQAARAARRVVAVQKDALNHPLDDNTGFLGATNVWPTLGGLEQRRLERRHRRDRHGHLAREPDDCRRPGLPAPPHPLAFYKGCEFGDGTDVGAPRPDVRVQQQADRRVRQDADLHVDRRAPTVRSSATTRRTCARRVTPRATARTPTTTAGGDRVDLRRAVRRRARAGLRHRSWRARRSTFRVCLVQRLLQLRLRVGSVQQAIHDGVNVINFSISGGGSPYTDPVELAFLDAFNAGISVNASAGNSGPGAATSDHGGPWVTTVGASTGPRSFTSTLHLTADGGATLDVSGVTLTNGISSATPVVHGRDAAEGRRRQRGRALPVRPRSGQRRRARSSSATAGSTAASTRAAGSSPAARRG